jgi:hypothetical protein
MAAEEHNPRRPTAVSRVPTLRPLRRDRETFTHKAAVVRAFRQPLRIEELPKPEPGVSEIIVKIEAVVLCHFDIGGATRTSAMTALAGAAATRHP